MKGSMKKIANCVLALSLLASSVAFSADKATLSRFSAGDAAWKERVVEERARFALTEYRKLYAETPQDFEAAWRVAMICYLIGIRYTQDSDTKKDIFTEGRKAGDAAVALKDDCAPCHFWTAINMALYADTVGPLKVLVEINALKAHLKRTIEIEPTFAYAGAHRLMGQINHKLPGIFGGSYDESERHFEKAISLGGNEPLNFLFYAYMLKDWGKTDRAIEVAERGLKIRDLTPDRMEAFEAQRDIKIFLKENAPPQTASHN